MKSFKLKNKSKEPKKEEIKSKFDGDISSINIKLKDLQDKYKKAKEGSENIQNKINEHNSQKQQMIKSKSDLDKDVGAFNSEKNGFKTNGKWM